MTDVIGDLDHAHKMVMRLWVGAVTDKFGKKLVLSYPKYRVLKAVNSGLRYSYEIYEHANVVNSTVQVMLDDLHNRGWLLRGDADKRTFIWGMTASGIEALRILDLIVESLEKGAINEVKNLKRWTD